MDEYIPVEFLEEIIKKNKENNLLKNYSPLKIYDLTFTLIMYNNTLIDNHNIDEFGRKQILERYFTLSKNMSKNDFNLLYTNVIKNN